MILFFDTETTGLAEFNKRASDPSQPHIVQCASILADEDGKIIDKWSEIVAPEGWVIPPEVTAVHGITNDIAHEQGEDESIVADLLMDNIKCASLIVGFNIMFDKFIARIAMRRYGLLTDEMDAWWKALPTFCVMREMTEICKLAPTRGGKYKFPKLQEAYTHAFGREFAGAHGAMADVTATKELYFWLRTVGGK